MTPQQKRKLEKLSRVLDEAQSLLSELLSASEESIGHEHQTDFDARSFLVTLRNDSRGDAECRLGAMKQSELGAVFVESGGPSGDKKKPKVWLVEQILWRVFDFERGHEAIRNKSGDEN